MPGEKAIYYPTKDSEVIAYYDNAITRLAGGLATKYSIGTATMLVLQTHNLQLTDALINAINDDDISQASTLAKDEELAQAKIDLLRVFRKISDLPDFEEPDAELLGIRRFKTKPNLRKVKPVITGVTVLEERVIIDWFKGGMSGVIVYRSYTGKRFAEISRDMYSPFEDRDLNKTLEPEERYYKLRYLKDDKKVGLVSNVVKVVANILTPYIEPEPEPEVYVIEMVTDQDTADGTVNLTLKGEAGETALIIWGDLIRDDVVYDETEQTFSHTYSIAREYNIMVRTGNNLLYFIAQDCKLTSVPAFAPELTKIERIMLPINRLTSFPDISTFVNIKYFNLFDNYLTEVDSYIIIINTFQTYDGQINTSGINNALANGTTIPIIQELISRGWIVTTTTFP